MMNTALDGHLTTIVCPSCGAEKFRVVRPAKYPAEISLEEFRDAFRASSDHSLLDQLVCCQSCSLVYINPRVSEEILLGGYSDAVDPDFVAQNPERIKTFTRMTKKILERLKIAENSGLKILDVGCAGGAFLVAAQDCGLQPVGIEPNHWAADFGRRTYGLDIHQGILTPGRFPDSSFDMVSLWDVIEHLTEPGVVLKTIRAVLKPSGVLIVNFPDYGSWVARLMGDKWPFLLSVHLLYYTRATMTQELRRAGFEVLNIRPHFQSLPLGYVLRRATPYMGLAGPLRSLAEAIGMGSVPLRYNLGQTLVVARKI